jgi:diguanylate cyclase (GGDEF)-like protein
MQPLGPSVSGGVALFVASLHAFAVVGAPGTSILVDASALVVSLVATSVLVASAWKATTEQISRLFEIQLSLGVLTTAFLAVRMDGPLPFDAFPLVYLVLALLLTFQSRVAGIASVGIALALHWGPLLLGGAAWDPNAALTHSLFIVVFGLLSVVVQGTEMLERRRQYRLEVAEERENLLRQAREFRLMSTRRSDAPSSREEAEELITRDAVDAVNHSVYAGLSLLKTGLKAHTVVLLWLDVNADRLRIKELVSDSDALIEGTIEPARGVIGGITRRREPVSLRDVRPGFRGISYYRSPQGVTSFLGVPVIEDGHLRGVLCLDRIDGENFDEEEEALVAEVADHIVRTLENERLFTTIERSKYELSRFFDASRRLNGTLTPQQVYDVALDCASDLAPYELAAITLWDDTTNTHRVVAIDREDEYDAKVDDWLGLEFSENTGLVSMVVKNSHYLPFGGNLREGRTVLFTKEEVLDDLSSMLVLPLIVGDQPIGTFIVAHRRAAQFSTERREMLEVVANQIAVTLQNARLYSKMEEMATTDGLTGLANHRTFQAKLDETLARHRRQKREFCLLLTDIDHFKNVNDTHGHPVGDEVLRQVARCFESCLRETDVPCRYGCEEFAIILEDTDVEGARVIAERLREEVAKLGFTSEAGSFSCTISIGIGHWPADAAEKQELIDLTDQALYHSKHTGRNKVTAHYEIARKAS